ncbi:MAG: transposase [Nitrososphaeraceae archaeon]
MGIQTEDTKKSTHQYCFKGGERGFQKRTREVLDTLPVGFTVVSIDESFFFYDSIVRRVWIYRNNRPVIKVTGSHKHSCLFGAISLEGDQLFRQYDSFDEDTFYDYLKEIHYKFPKCYLFMDKATPHYKSQKIRSYLEKHKDMLVPVWLPTASPEFMVLDECWNISRNDLQLLTYYSSFKEFTKSIGEYFRTKHFNLNMRNYLLASIG